MEKYSVKKGVKILTKKRKMVTNFVTVDDLGGDESLINSLIDNGSIYKVTLEKEKNSTQEVTSKKAKK